ncbi:NIPSNAP family protein [Luteimonas panaciterrae]|uniref:NIPSNAP family protein n=1 Tax=Luteimonas panaciterrae TaxID=363885 RepID=UPI001CFA6294|nr:NIPSNAP family protein [Luteimonas panaciterrae]
MREAMSTSRWRAILLGIVVLFCLAAGQAVAADKPAADVIHQLRIYEIFDGNKQQFHERFRDHAMRIMARYDFKIVATWESKNEDRTEFVYLLEWPDKQTMDDRWAKFMADQEWSDIKKASRKYGAMVGEIESRTLVPTEYSPRTRLID